MKPGASASQGHASGLSKLLSPRTPHAFLTDSWETNAVHVARDDRDHYADLLSIQIVEDLVAGDKIPARNLLLIKDSQPYPDLYIRDGNRSLLPRIRRAWTQGYTVAINSLHLRHRPVLDLTHEIEGELGYRAMANMYLTPGGAQGFRLHFDNHHAMLLQISGSKRWTVYPPVVALPLIEQHREVKPEELGEPILDVEVKAGDTLYVPPGFPHSGTSTDEASLHVTVGIYPTTWGEFIKASIDALQIDDPRLRSAVPAGLLAGARLSGAEEFADLAAMIARDWNFDDALKRSKASFEAQRTTAWDNLFGADAAIPELTSLTVVRTRPGGTYRTWMADDHAVLDMDGIQMIAPEPASAAFEFIAGSRSFAVGALPGLDGDSQIVLANRLIREGLLMA